MNATEFGNLFYASNDSEQYELVLKTTKSITVQYPNITTRNSVFTGYRDVLGIKGLGGLPPRHSNETLDMYSARLIKSNTPIYTFAGALFRLDTAERDYINEQYRIKVKNQMQNLVKIENVPEFLAVSEELLVSQMYNRQILGLLALTGRRTVEIALTGSLDPISDTTAMFEGQAKTGDNESLPYVIPVLSDSSKLRDSILTLRSKKPEFLDYTHENLNNTIASALSRIVKHEYKRVFSPDYNITVHSLRGVYGAICTAFFKPVNVDGGEYLSTILGHSALDFTTRASYLKFYINEE